MKSVRDKTALPFADIPESAWKKAAASAGESDCVEVANCAYTPRKGIAVRDSKNPQGPILLFRQESFSAFVSGVDGICR
ncbi:hypothetical protein GCM10010387_18940 [Streptomyces inusitatus]|uniref:DUF397 domain-containing protein n=1 Tax=Streptomyces inusitatus TaxID=68221 RepID=A0A918PWE2_9ACTN|nr:DUF397 domain-containing protein [Streptomyces inusitatus]GGZ25599.1 hypothetical protein GCM10010387_18940 [Streptomyces inusitatus]